MMLHPLWLPRLKASNWISKLKTQWPPRARLLMCAKTMILKVLMRTSPHKCSAQTLQDLASLWHFSDKRAEERSTCAEPRTRLTAAMCAPMKIAASTLALKAARTCTSRSSIMEAPRPSAKSLRRNWSKLTLKPQTNLMLMTLMSWSTKPSSTRWTWICHLALSLKQPENPDSYQWKDWLSSMKSPCSKQLINDWPQNSGKWYAKSRNVSKTSSKTINWLQNKTKIEN